MLKRFVTKVSLFILMLSLLSLGACSSRPDGEISKNGDGYYIKVNDTIISKEYIGYFFYVAQLNMIKEAGMTVGEGGNSTREDIDTFWTTTEIEGKSAVDVARDLAADNAVIQKVQYLKAIEEGIALTEEEKSRLSVQIDSTIASEGGEMAFQERLSDMGSDLDAYKQILTENMFVQKLYELYDSQGMIAVSNAELAEAVASLGADADADLVLESMKKDKFNQKALDWEKEYTISISDEKMKEFNVK